MSNISKKDWCIETIRICISGMTRIRPLANKLAFNNSMHCCISPMRFHCCLLSSSLTLSNIVSNSSLCIFTPAILQFWLLLENFKDSGSVLTDLNPQIQIYIDPIGTRIQWAVWWSRGARGWCMNLQPLWGWKQQNFGQSSWTITSVVSVLEWMQVTRKWIHFVWRDKIP